MDTKQRKQPAGPTGQESKKRKTAAPRKEAARRPAGKTQRERSAGTPEPPKRQRSAQAEQPRKQRAARSAQPPRRRRRPVVRTEPRHEHVATPTPEVVYTPARPFNRNRLLLQLLSVAAIVVAMVLGISIFFKVDADKIMVSGAQKYDAYMIREASGIKDGDNLLTFGQAKAGGKITTALPYVKDVRIGIKLPDTVHIEITEYDVVYAIQAKDNSWWLITASGKVVEQVDNATAEENTVISGVKLLSPRVQGQAAAFEAAQMQTTPTEASADAQTEATEAAQAVTVPKAAVSADQQLETALSILQALEENSVIGTIASVDVSDIANLQMWYGDRYQILLGSSSDLEYKIGCMRKAVEQLESYQRGILDVSFTTWPDQVSYTPFS